MVTLGGLGPVQFRPVEGLRILGIGHDGGIPPHAFELLDAAFRRRLAQLRLGVGGEELPRRGGAVFLPHKEHGRERGRQREDGRQSQPAVGQRLGKSVAGGAVADLVVVLAAHHQGCGVHQPGVNGPPVVPAAEAGVAAVVEEPVAQHLGQGAQRIEVAVVPLRLAADVHVDGVVEVVAPLALQSVPVDVAGVQQAGVVEVRLRDHGDRAAGFRGHSVAQGTELLQEVDRPLVLEGVHGVDPQPVDVVVPEPHGRVVQDVTADLV
ncbi:hypothetical protein D9M72_483130 [compost metagenome]